MFAPKVANFKLYLNVNTAGAPQPKPIKQLKKDATPVAPTTANKEIRMDKNGQFFTQRKRQNNNNQGQVNEVTAQEEEEDE